MSGKFQAGVATEDQRKEVDIGAAVCGGMFYLVIFVQLIMFIVVLASQNAKIPADGECPDGYKFRSGFYCIEDSLREEQTQCALNNANNGPYGGRRLDSGITSMDLTFMEHLQLLTSNSGPASPKRDSIRRLAYIRGDDVNVPADLWQFLEEFVEMPIVIFAATFFVASLWLFAMTKATGPVVWGTLAFDIFVMVFGVIWCWVELESFNWMLAVLAVGFTVGLIVLRNQIKTAIVVMHKAMEGLTENARLFPVSFGVTLLWVGFFALWIASLIGLDMVKTIGDGDYPCDVVNKYPGALRWLWIIVYYWSTFFFNNAKLVIITAQLGEWFFKGESADKSIWLRASVWAFHPLKSGGANAACSAIMGFSQLLMHYVNNRCRMILAMFNPIEWIPLCLAFALKTVIHTYTKFGLVAQVMSGQAFCTSAGNAFELLKTKLGEAVICDYIGKRVMSWCTYLLSLGVAMAALTWANVLQNYDEANDMFKEVWVLILVMLFLAWLVSMPFFSIVVIVLLEAMLPNDMHITTRAILNSFFAAIFMGSITNFLLTTMSHVVVSSMDVMYFCFAVEDDLGQKQERFEDLYKAIKMTITPGSIANSGVVTGTPPTGMPNHVTIPIQVPAGSGPGETLQIEAPNGQQVQVQVPPGVMAGQVFNAAVPNGPVVVKEAPPVASVVGVPTNTAANNESNEVPPV